ncbi:MAG: DUF2017 domain-containing protein [Actinomycetia bacterium]|nr:DUF2017 domain-containing protein [Actinomycetes bacterium]
MRPGFHRSRGRVVLRLRPGEAAVLGSLLHELLDLLAEPEPTDRDPLEALVGIGTHTDPPDDPVLARLFPSAYADDAVAAGEFRRYTEPELRGAKRAQAGTALGTLPRAVADRGATLSRAECSSWLLTLNDLRLALGTRLDVSEDWVAEYEALPQDAPARLALEVYDWLAWLQGTLIELLSG